MHSGPAFAVRGSHAMGNAACGSASCNAGLQLAVIFSDAELKRCNDPNGLEATTINQTK